MYEATLKSAMEYSRQDNLKEWVHQYLLGEGDNKVLLEHLMLASAEYEGPKLLNLSLISRIYGPEPDMEYNIPEDNTEQIKKFWKNIKEISERYKAGNWDMPPLIIYEENENEYEIYDGNHRLEALKMLGINEYWVIQEITTKTKKASSYL